MGVIDVKKPGAWIYCNWVTCIIVSLVAAAVVWAIGKWGLPKMGITRSGDGMGPKLAGALIGVAGVGTTVYYKYVADPPGAAGDTCPA